MVGVGLAACPASLRAIAAVLVGAAWTATRARRPLVGRQIRRFLRNLSMGVADLLGEWVDTT
jgi:hypothetical protein